jgi:hypothetical protein
MLWEVYGITFPASADRRSRLSAARLEQRSRSGRSLGILGRREHVRDVRVAVNNDTYHDRPKMAADAAFEHDSLP